MRSTEKDRHTEATGRGARRRTETRARLVAAARELMARQGIDATSIQNITDTADVGWGWFLIRTAFLGPGSLDGTLGRRMVRDVERGVASGRFAIDDPLATMLAAGGAVLALMAGRLRGEMDDDVPERAGSIVLRLLGLSGNEAHEVSRRPLSQAPRLRTSID